jgi:DDE family transposase
MMDYEQIARAIVEEAIAVDAAETAVYGERRGDELPETVATTHGRQSWLRDARQRLDQQRAERAEPIPRARPQRLLEAKRRPEEDLSAEREANANFEAYHRRGVMRDGRRMSARPKPYTPPATPPGRINLTDPDSRLVHGMRGWLQGYNAQAVCNEQYLILAAEVMTASPDFGQLGPMLAAARTELAGAGVSEAPGVVVADAGYWHLEQMNAITGGGIPVLIPPDSSRRKNTNTRPGWTGGAYDFMRSVLSTPRGSELYKQRAQQIEPIFGNTKHNRGFTRFARRGRSAARTEWRLIATTHNLRG